MVAIKIVYRLNVFFQMSFTDKLFHLQFIPNLDQFFTFIGSRICYYTITQVVDIGPSWPSCLIVNVLPFIQLSQETHVFHGTQTLLLFLATIKLHD